MDFEVLVEFQERHENQRPCRNCLWEDDSNQTPLTMTQHLQIHCLLDLICRHNVNMRRKKLQ